MKTHIPAAIILAFGPFAFGADKVDNPLFPLWPSTEGAEVQFERTVTVSGGVPSSETVKRVNKNGDVVVEFKPSVNKERVTYRLSKATPEELTIMVGKYSFVIPARVEKETGAAPKLIKTEHLKIGDKTYACKVYAYTASLAEAGSQPTTDWPVSATVWVSPDVRGGVIRRKLSYTMKASLDIEDILVPSAPEKAKVLK